METRRLCKPRGALAVLSALLCLGGCASFEGAPDRPERSPGLEQLDKGYAEAMARYYAAETQAARTAVRNQFIETRAGLIDRQYAAFKSKLYAQRVGSAVGVDLATLGLNIAGVLSPGEHAKTAMNALSGGLVGGKSSVDKNVYFDRTLPAMLSQMEGQRGTVRMRLLTGMDETVKTYPLMQAAADLEAYYTAGTLSGAVTAITQQASAVEAAAAANLAARLPTALEVQTRLREEHFEVHVAAKDDTAAKRLRACLRPEGQRLPAHEAAVREWLRKKGQDSTSPLATDILLTRPDQAALREEVLKDKAFLDAVPACR